MVCHVDAVRSDPHGIAQLGSPRAILSNNDTCSGKTGRLFPGGSVQAIALNGLYFAGLNCPFLFNAHLSLYGTVFA
jgi:hypothetical protein